MLQRMTEHPGNNLGNPIHIVIAALLWHMVRATCTGVLTLEGRTPESCSHTGAAHDQDWFGLDDSNRSAVESFLAHPGCGVVRLQAKLFFGLLARSPGTQPQRIAGVPNFENHLGLCSASPQRMPGEFVVCPTPENRLRIPDSLRMPATPENPAAVPNSS